MSDRFRTLPLWVLVPIMFVVIGGLWFLLQTTLQDRHRPPWIDLAAAALYAAVMTTVFSLRTVRARQQVGGRGQMRALLAALRTGVLPAEADRTTWEPTLWRWRQQYRRGRWVTPVAIVVLAAVTFQLGLTEHPVWFVIVGLFIVLGITNVLTTRRALRNIDPLLAALEHATPPVHAGSTAPAPTPGAHWPGAV